MSEYVVDFEVAIEEYHIETHNPSWANERIVRCRDCKHLVGVGMNFYYCELFRARGPYDYELHKPAYDGFCAWGERREYD